MFVRQEITCKKGQALVEAALIAPLIVFFLFTIIWFAHVVLTWQQLVGAARYGADLIAYTPYSEKEISRSVRNYLCHESNIGRILDKSTDTLKIEVHTADFPVIDFSAGSILLNPFKIMSAFNVVYRLIKSPFYPDMSYVEISYKFKMPPVLRLYRRHMEIKARAEVLSGSGSPGENKRRK